MHSLKLYHKYFKGKHWERHPTIYAETFTNFLKKHHFKGLLIDIGCGNGRDIDVFTRAGLDAIGIDKEISSAQTNFPKVRFEIQDIEKLSFIGNLENCGIKLELSPYNISVFISYGYCGIDLKNLNNLQLT